VTQKSLFLKNVSGVSVERYLKAVRVPQKSPILSRFLLGSCADNKTLDPVSTPKGSLYSFQVLACQFLMTLRQINLPQWSHIYDMLTSVALRSTQQSVRKILAHGPPVTGRRGQLLCNLHYCTMTLHYMMTTLAHCGGHLCAR
jgi:hypothetical protein